MKSIKTTVTIAFVSLGALTALKPAAAQTGVDPWTGAEYDTSNCVGFNSCYVDSGGNVSGSNNLSNPYHFEYNSDYTNEYRQLQQF